MPEEAFFAEEALIDEYRLKIKEGYTNIDDLARLLIRYEELLREMKCLTKVSDRLQLKLQSVIERVETQNSQLATTVESTTMELEAKVSTLDQYRFDLSHSFRVPIASLLGIIDLMNSHSMNEMETRTVFEIIKNTSLQIDDVIRDLDHQLGSSVNA